MPKMVPLGSLPAMTSAWAHPGTGFFTSCVVNASHVPFTADTSMALAFTSWSIMEEWPMVPAMMTVLFGAGSV